jgi:hypothetical protein
MFFVKFTYKIVRTDLGHVLQKRCKNKHIGYFCPPKGLSLFKHFKIATGLIFMTCYKEKFSKNLKLLLGLFS